jgi:hypothetical protein
MIMIIIFNFIVLVHIVYSLQPSNDLVKRTNERPVPKFDIDLNKSPPREDVEKEQEIVSLLGIGQSSSQDPKSSSLRPRTRPYKYYPRKQAHELSQNKKSIKYRIHREKLRNSENQDALIFRLEKQRERMIPLLEKYRKETKELGYSNRPDVIKKSQLRKKVREGKGTEEEREYVQKINKQLKEAPSQKKQMEQIKQLRKKVKLGTASKEETEIVNKRKKSDKEYYQRRKKRKAESKD